MVDPTQPLTERQIADIEVSLRREQIEGLRGNKEFTDRLVARAVEDGPRLAELRRLWEAVEPGSYTYLFLDERGADPLRARLASDPPTAGSRPLSDAELRLAAAALNYTTHLLETTKP